MSEDIAAKYLSFREIGMQYYQKFIMSHNLCGFYIFFNRFPSEHFSNAFRMFTSEVTLHGWFIGSFKTLTKQAVVNNTFVYFIMLIELELRNI